MSRDPENSLRLGLLFLSLFGLLLAACSRQAPNPRGTAAPRPQPVATSGAGPTLTPFQPLPNATTIVEAASGSTSAGAAETALSIWVAPYLPQALRSRLRLPPILQLVDQRDGADLQLAIGESPELSLAVYALVTPFPTLVDDLNLDEIRGAWSGKPGGSFDGRPLLMAPGTLAAFTAHWGPPADGAVETFPAAELLEAAWDRRPSWGIVPFEALTPRWKVLSVEGQSPIWKEFDPAAYALALPVGLSGDPALAEAVATLFGPGTAEAMLPPSNRNPDRMTVLNMTGVTALVRATAWTMEVRGLTYPARDIGGWLQEADLTHISNEVPFARDCPPPDPVQEGLRFCSDPRYIALLEEVGTDVVELTGDHFQDWGAEAMRYTLELYRERGWQYYGGGESVEDGRRPAKTEHNGNRLAFIGCNAKGRAFAGASAGSPGAVTCDFEWMHDQIRSLRSDGYLPIVTFQHFEYYTYQALPNQVADFGGMAAAGAAIVSGSQAHQPQAIAFEGEAFIHYGLGNLFFDQLDVSYETRLAYIDRHIFYEGQHISTELLTLIFEDYARARPMDGAERRELLRQTFAASGW